MLAFAVIPGLRGVDSANFAAVFSSVIQPEIDKMGVKKTGNLFPRFPVSYLRR